MDTSVAKRAKPRPVSVQMSRIDAGLRLGVSWPAWREEHPGGLAQRGCDGFYATLDALTMGKRAVNCGICTGMLAAVYEREERETCINCMPAINLAVNEPPLEDADPSGLELVLDESAGAKRKNQTHDTIQDFIAKNPQHMLEVLDPARFPAMAVPIWCGVCEKALQGQWAHNCRRLQYHCTTCAVHARKLLALTKPTPSAIEDSKEVDCDGFETRMDTDKRNLVTQYASSLRICCLALFVKVS